MTEQHRYIELWCGDYRIRKSPPRARPSDDHPQLISFCGLAADQLWILYIVTQFSIILSVQWSHHEVLWSLWFCIFVELCASIQDLIAYLGTIFARYTTRETAGYRLRYFLSGEHAPSVDVVIPCCGEDIDVIANTARAAAVQDYPKKSLRVFILDDGQDDGLREEIQALSREFAAKNGPEVGYLSRRLQPGEKSYYKSGNLQFGIEATNQLGGSEYLASLDADMIPDKDWLRKVIPHLILDGKMAVACPVQSYYNIPSGDPFGQQAEFDIFLDVYEQLDDRLDPSMLTGSGFVVRRAAIEDISGWPQVDTGEDFIGACVFSYADWKVACLREILQTGLAPDTLRSHIRQRERWVDSGIIVHKYFDYYLPGRKATLEMSWTLRGVGILGILREYAPIGNLLGMLLLPLSVRLSHTSGDVHQIPSHSLIIIRVMFVLAYIARRINNFVIYGSIGVRRVQNLTSNDIWCSPYTALRCFLSILPESIHQVNFISTACVSGGINERSKTLRKHLIYRLCSVDVLLPVTFIFYTISLTRNYYTDVVLLGPIMKLVDYCCKGTVPVLYMIWPPTVLPRRQLTEEDEDGVMRPTARAMVNGREKDAWSWRDIVELAVLTCALAC